MTVRVTLPADPRSAHAARRVVARSLTEWGLAALQDDVELLVSELVANAVLHARSRTELVVTPDGGGVRVEVCDDSPAPPRRRHADLTAGTGRGLQLLDAVATRWGVQSAGHGKCVWFALDGAPPQRWDHAG